LNLDLGSFRDQWKRHFKSTRTANEKEAEEICHIWTEAAKAGRDGKLTPDSAREIVARGVADIFAAASHPIRRIGNSGDDDNERVASRDPFFDLRPELLIRLDRSDVIEDVVEVRSAEKRFHSAT